MAVNLADTASLLTEVTNVFTPEDDVNVVKSFLGTKEQIERTAAEKRDEIKQIVRGALPSRRASLAAASRRTLPRRRRPRSVPPAALRAAADVTRRGCSLWCVQSSRRTWSSCRRRRTSTPLRSRETRDGSRRRRRR